MKQGNSLEIVRGMLQAMADSNSPDELCDFLANDVLSELGVVASYLAVLDSDGRITMVGSWGYPASRRSPDDRPSLWYPMAITDTIRTGKVHSYGSWDEYIDRYPHLEHRASPGKSFVCIPFSNKGRRAGGLGLSFGQELPEVGDHEEIWEILAQAGGLFVSKSWAGGVFRPNAYTAEKPMDEAELRSSLTARELEVIQLTSDGKTVAQISRILNFSESTIKQTRMAVYRKLGVKRAGDLPHAIQALGLARS